MIVEQGLPGNERIVIVERTKKVARSLVSVVRKWRQERIDQIKVSNPYGYLIPEFVDVTERDKKDLWLKQGGKEFIGEAGEIRRYVVGIPIQAMDFIRRSGFNIKKKTFIGAAIPFFGGTEGKGVYATTNPELASREYGPALAVVDIALGKKATVDDNFFLKVLDKTKELQRFAAGAYTGSILALEALSLLVGAKMYPQDAILAASAFVVYSGHGIIWRFFQELSGTDSMVISPNQLPTLVKRIPEAIKGNQEFWDLIRKAEFHKEWVVIKDPNRVKVIGVFGNYKRYQDANSPSSYERE